MNPEQISHLLGCEGWCSEEKMKRLYALVLQTAEEFKDVPLLSVELGVFAGRSFYPLALAHKQLRCGYAMGIDAWDNVTPQEGTNSKANNDWWAALPVQTIYHNFIESGKTLGTGEYAKHLTGKTETFFNRFQNESITLLHQDSNHNIETITRELELYTPKISPGGYWVADDTDWVEARAGYSRLPSYGFELVESYGKWEVWRKRGE